MLSRRNGRITVPFSQIRKSTKYSLIYFSLGVTQSYADEEFEEYNSDEEADKPRLTE